MAIDDNTVYGLTGAQVKELPEKIEAVKGLARELTADDYNWPTSDPDGVALWLLENGLYHNAQDVKLYYSTDGSATGTAYDILIAKGSSSTKLYMYNPSSSVADITVRVIRSDGSLARTQDILNDAYIVDNLTSTRSDRILSAAQGKALKDLIDAIVVPTKTSDLTNDSNFVTSTEMTTALADKADTSAIPTALSDLTNDINAVSDSNYVHTDNNYTTTEKTKLAGIASGAEANVQSDWNQTNTTADDYIKNKPTIPDVSGKLDNTTTFWGQTASNGAVNGTITFDANDTIGTTTSGGTTRLNITGNGGITLNTNSDVSVGARLTNVSTGTTNTDAVNLGQLNSAISGIDAPTITMTDTDPGEGAALEADHYIGVYGDTAEIPVIGDILSAPSDVAYVDTANIVNGAVTEDKIDFTTMKKWVPDYNNQQSIGNINSYTAAEDGWIVVGYYGYSTSGIYTATITVNSKTVYSDSTEALSPNNARASRGQVMVPVSVGDVVTWPNDSSVEQSYFIPGKWV